jgi:dipeptidyl aminopeptidase/acylaminoacyl peptidase
MMVLGLRPGARPIVIDHGGDYLRRTFDFRGMASFPTGVPLPIEPQWSRDGRWIAYLKRVGKVTQVWRAGRGIPASPITASSTDVETFVLSADNASITYSSRPGLATARRAIEEEALGGFRFDARFSPMASNRPFVPATVPTEFSTQDLASNDLRPATEKESNLLSRASGTVETPGKSSAIWSPEHRAVWRTSDNAYPPIYGIRSGDANGQEVQCVQKACSGRISLPWWSADGTRVRYFRREGWALSSTGLYEWTPGSGGAPRRILSTDDDLSACRPVSDDLLCLRESATTPRRIELIKASTGKSTVVFDPNPELAKLDLGRVKTLRWNNSFGIESYGHLVLPVGYKKGIRYPLVVVGYEDRGFLRGGTGDEYPIQAFAAAGYAVLSYDRPQMVGLQPGVKDGYAVERLNLRGFEDRRSILSSLEVAVLQLISDGLVDSERVGITGFSDGATTVQFALLHSRLFAAAAMSHGSWEANYPIVVGQGAMADLNAAGYPSLTDNVPAFWKEFSLRPSAAEIDTPILAQVPDDEYLSDLEGYIALRAHRKPMDLFVFPSEHHVKWQPAHRLAIYRRNLDWFDYWLKGLRSKAVDRKDDLVHWDALKAEMELSRSAGPPTH